MTYRLYYAPGSAAMAPHAALEEIGAPFEAVRLDIAKGEHKTPEFLRLNPKARVPVLVEGEFVLTESAAIVAHLADRHPAAGLAPTPATPERARFYEWLFYLANTVQPAFADYFHPDWSLDGEAERARLKASAERRLNAMFDHIGTHLAANGPFVLGARFSGADLYLHMLTRWSRWLARPGYRIAAVKRCTDAVKARPAVRRTMAAQGLVEEEKA